MEIHVNGTWIKMGMNRLEMFSDGVLAIRRRTETPLPCGALHGVSVALDIRPGGG
jgi:hypothetical protein